VQSLSDRACALVRIKSPPPVLAWGGLILFPYSFTQDLTFMIRFGQRLSWLLLGTMLIGCGGGLEEGVPKEISGDGQTAESKEYAAANLKNMTKVSKPKNAPDTTTKKAP
jgi:hypothetical protein